MWSQYQHIKKGGWMTKLVELDYSERARNNHFAIRPFMSESVDGAAGDVQVCLSNFLGRCI